MLFNILENADIKISGFFLLSLCDGYLVILCGVCIILICDARFGIPPICGYSSFLWFYLRLMKFSKNNEFLRNKD